MAITFSWNNPNTAEYLPEFTNIYRSDAPFEAEALPAAFAVLSGAAMSYTDLTALDNQTYYYRVSFKLGIKEEISRLIEIKAPTEPTLFSTHLVDSVFPCSTLVSGAAGDHLCVADSFKDAKWPIMLGTPVTFGRWINHAFKGSDGLILRLAALAAIQRFRRSVWLTEGLTIKALSEFWIGHDTGVNEGINAGTVSGIAAGSTMTWQEAFNMIAKCQGVTDIILNVFNELKDDICGSLTSMRGRPAAYYTVGFALSGWHQYVSQLGGYRPMLNPVRGSGGRFLSNGTAGSPISTIVDKQYAESEPLAIVRVVAAVCIEFPEIETALRVWGQETAITYKDPSANVIDFLSTATNSRDKADCLQGILINTTTVGGANSLSARQRSVNGNFSFYNDMIAISEQSNNHAGGSHGNNIGGFFHTTSLNGKDFTAVFANGQNGAISAFNVGHIWNRATRDMEHFLEGLSDVDPMESSVLFRYLPNIANGLVNSSGPATVMTPTGAAAWDIATHYSSAVAGPGFPNPAFAVRGTDPTNPIPTILTDLDMLAYIRAGTSFTIEMFMTAKHNTLAAFSNNPMSLIELGCVNSGFRYDAIISNFGDMAFAVRRNTSHTANPIYDYLLGMYTKGSLSNNWAQHAAANGSDFDFHIVLQYDAITNRFEFFINGVIIRHWTPFAPGAGVAGRLAFFGCAATPTDTVTQRHFAQTGHMMNEFLIHELVVTIGKRYNYGCFIGKVPFARRRFTV